MIAILIDTVTCSYWKKKKNTLYKQFTSTGRRHIDERVNVKRITEQPNGPKSKRKKNEHALRYKRAVVIF